ncbi:MAG: FAD-binding oxidoreductase [Terriglobales bacterium]
MIPKSALQKFRTSLRGQSLCPGEQGYDTARTIHNASIDRRPAMIARCTGVADVIACVRFAREHDVLVSVRGGGHSIAGKAVCDDGLMIDLSGMKAMRVDPAGRTARAEPGLTLGEFDRETQAFGLATTLGVVSRTGIAGLTLGGGLGWLMGKYGLACDNLISADVVTAEGRLLTASATQNDDLFWGLRGAGGNFGVVTSLEYRLYEVGPVLGGGVFYPAEKTREVLRFYRDFIPSAPEELSTQAAAVTLPDVGRMVGIAGCYCGPIAEGEKLLKPLRTFGPPAVDLFAPIPYVQLQSMLDPFFPPGRHAYTKANFLNELSDGAIDAFAAYATAPSPYTSGVLEHLGGAFSRVPPAETAFAHRTYPYNFSIWANWVDAADTEKNIRWSRDFWDAMRPFMGAGAYVNYLEDEADPRVREAYGPNYERLVALKSRYDPTNFFRMNHNIRPTQ